MKHRNPTFKRWLVAASAAFFLALAPVHAAEIDDLNITDASNIGRFPENMAPSAVNDGARALEGLIARWHENTNALIATTGSANAYVLAARGTQVLFDGFRVCFDANFGNTGSATLNVDATGAITIQKFHNQNLVSGDIEANQKVCVVYDGTNFQMLSQLATGVTLSSPVTVAEGGTGLTTITDGGVMLGSGAGNVTPMAVLTDGQFIVGDGTTDPVAESGATVRTSLGLGTTDTVEFNILGVGNARTEGTAHILTSSAGAVTASTLADDLVVETADAEGGISVLNTVTSTGRLMFSAPARINDGGVIYDHSGRRLDLVAQGVAQLFLSQTSGTFAAGLTVRMLGQPGFLAQNTVTDTNITGNGTFVTVEFNSEVYDTGVDFNNTTDTFTAPVDGRYLLTAQVRITAITTAADFIRIRLLTSNRTYETNRVNTNNLGGTEIAQITVVADMDASDTVTVTVAVNGEASDVNDIFGSTPSPQTFFSGSLLN